MTDDVALEVADLFDTATLYEANGKRGALPHEIKPIDHRFRVVGPAFTVEGPPGDNLWLHRAIAMAARGDVIVASVRGGYNHGYWGEVMATAAQERGIAGLIIDACVRDGALLSELGFPVFARGLCIRGTAKDATGAGRLNNPLAIGDVIIEPGDLIVGDGDGVVVIAQQRISMILQEAKSRQESELKIITRLKQGETTLQIYNLSPSPSTTKI
jgi:4-hydroxy-4-methyl-2-oxoglutarate aldolase